MKKKDACHHAWFAAVSAKGAKLCCFPERVVLVLGKASKAATVLVDFAINDTSHVSQTRIASELYCALRMADSRD